tara:strand:+ start:109045 stop:109491 length:447 start_codon:yes stop_codon:yes gene_type:complete
VSFPWLLLPLARNTPDRTATWSKKFVVIDRAVHPAAPFGADRCVAVEKHRRCSRFPGQCGGSFWATQKNLTHVEIGPSRRREGITLEFTEHVITIRGRGLREGYQKLAVQRVVFIAEADQATALLVPEKEPVITSMSIIHKRAIPVGS